DDGARGVCCAVVERPPGRGVRAAPRCGACGWQPQPRARAIDFEEGELGLVVGGKANAPAYSEADRAVFFQQLRAVQQMRGYKRGWPAHKYKDKFGTFPPWAYDRSMSWPKPTRSTLCTL